MVARLSNLWVQMLFFLITQTEIKSEQLDIFISVYWDQQDGAIPLRTSQGTPESIIHLFSGSHKIFPSAQEGELSEQLLASHTVQFPSELLFWYLCCCKNRSQRGGTGDVHPVCHLPRISIITSH